MSIEALERELARLVHDYDPADRPALDRVLTRLAVARTEKRRGEHPMSGINDLKLSLTHHGNDLTFKGCGTSWEGDYEINTFRYACDCGFRVEITTTEFDPEDDS